MENLPDYRFDPEAYELEERYRPDEMRMLEAVGRYGYEILNRTIKALVLDLCCGTGLSIEALVNHPNVGVIVGVDNCEPYLQFARAQFLRAINVPIFLHADAVNVALPTNRWDVIMLCSAYHHIEDKRKVQFLCHVRELLASSGVAVVGENILPEYAEEDDQSYANAVRFFYGQVLKDASSAGDLPEFIEGLIRRVAQYGYDGEYEYKTSYNIFVRNVAQAGLRIVHESRVWPLSGPMTETTGGNYLFVIQRDERSRLTLGGRSESASRCGACPERGQQGGAARN